MARNLFRLAFVLALSLAACMYYAATHVHHNILGGETVTKVQWFCILAGAAIIVYWTSFEFLFRSQRKHGN